MNPWNNGYNSANHYGGYWIAGNFVPHAAPPAPNQLGWRVPPPPPPVFHPNPPPVDWNAPPPLPMARHGYGLIPEVSRIGGTTYFYTFAPLPPPPPMMEMHRYRGPVQFAPPPNYRPRAPAVRRPPPPQQLVPFDQVNPLFLVRFHYYKLALEEQKTRNERCQRWVNEQGRLMLTCKMNEEGEFDLEQPLVIEQVEDNEDRQLIVERWHYSTSNGSSMRAPSTQEVPDLFGLVADHLDTESDQMDLAAPNDGALALNNADQGENSRRDRNNLCE